MLNFLSIFIVLMAEKSIDALMTVPTEGISYRRKQIWDSTHASVFSKIISKWGIDMNISSRCEYACRAILELAQNGNNPNPVTAVHIAEKRDIPEKYLVHILLQLKRAGLVRSVRGAQGGYLLGRDPDTISLLDIVLAIDGSIMDPLPVNDSGGTDLKPAWREVSSQIEKVLSRFLVSDILARAAKGSMFYI